MKTKALILLAGWKGYALAAVAGALAAELGRELPVAPETTGAAYPALRETRMAAVVCEMATVGHAAGLAAVVGRSGAVARAVVRGLRRAWERPAPADDEGSGL